MEKTKKHSDYNFGGGCKAGEKIAWQKKRGFKNGMLLELPKKVTAEYVKDLSCLRSIAFKGGKKAASWSVPKEAMKLVRTGEEDGRQLFKAVLVEEKK